MPTEHNFYIEISINMGLNSEFSKRRNLPRERDKRPFSQDTL